MTGALHIEEVSASDGLLMKWNCQSALDMSNGSFHLDGIIGVAGEDNPLSTGNNGTISRAKKDNYLQELKLKSGELVIINFVIYWLFIFQII